LGTQIAVSADTAQIMTPADVWRYILARKHRRTDGLACSQPIDYKAFSFGWGFAVPSRRILG